MRAGLVQFARHGLARTSMGDIAREAGLSRPWLYLHYEGKPALLAAVADDFVATTMAAATAAWADTPGKLRDRLAATLLAKEMPLFRLYAAPHGAQLLAATGPEGSRASRLDAHVASMLGKALVAAGFGCAPYGGPAAFARTLGLLAGGLKHTAADEAALTAAVKDLARMAFLAAKRG